MQIRNRQYLIFITNIISPVYILNSIYRPLMRDHYPFGHSCTSRRINHISKIFWRIFYRIHIINRLTSIYHKTIILIQPFLFLQDFFLQQHQLCFAVIQYFLHPFLRIMEIHRQISSTSKQYAIYCHNLLPSFFHNHRYKFASLHPFIF